MKQCRVCKNWYRIESNLLTCLVRHEEEIRATREALAPPKEWEQEVEPGGVTPY